MLKKGYNFYFCTNVPGLNIFLTLRSMLLRGVSFFDTKVRISQRNRNRIRKYFSLFIRGPDGFEWWKKLGVENLVGQGFVGILYRGQNWPIPHRSKVTWAMNFLHSYYSKSFYIEPSESQEKKKLSLPQMKIYQNPFRFDEHCVP